MSTELERTLSTAAQLIAAYDSKIDASNQHPMIGKTPASNAASSAPPGAQASPGSAKGSVASADSGLVEDSVRQPIHLQTSVVDHDKLADANAERGLSRQSSRGGVSGVLQQLEQLIVSDEWTRKDSDTASNRSSARSDGPKLTELGRTLITSASLKAYIDLLGVHHRQSIAAWLYGNTSQALSGLFRFPNTYLHCSDGDSAVLNSVRGGIGHAAKLALRNGYGSEYSSKGWRVFSEQGAPVIYASPALHMDISGYFANEFGIGDTAVIKKCDSAVSEIEGRIDHVALEHQLAEDVSEGKKPLMVIAVVGSAILGQNDLVSRILELRKKYKFWLHIVGQTIAALSMREPTEVLVNVLSQADSMSFPLAQWLGIPAAPVVTLHRSVEGYKPSYRERLDTLPWWVAMQHLTLKRIAETVETAYHLSKTMLKGLASLRQMEILGIDNSSDLAARVSKGQLAPPTVLIFKYKYAANEKTKKDVSQENAEPDSSDETFEEIEYADSLNTWLGQGLISECRQLGLHMVELGGTYGTAFRFCPLESAAACGTRHDHVTAFVKQLGETLTIVDATVAARQRLSSLLQSHTQLCRVPVQKWAGVGAVCYIPSIVKETQPSDWNSKQKQQVSHLNVELVHTLRATDTAFSSGESAAIGVSCTKFGMLADEKDLDDLISMVAERGKTIEQSSQYMESLAEMIRQGIEAASNDLKKENDERLMHEGVIRQLPIMGSLVNWLSPIGKDVSNIRGRTFDLKTGEIHSTDVLYKHRLQLDGAPLTPKSPIETPQFPHASFGATPVATTEVVDTTLGSSELSKDSAPPAANGPVMQQG